MSCGCPPFMSPAGRPKPTNFLTCQWRKSFVENTGSNTWDFRFGQDLNLRPHGKHRSGDLVGIRLLSLPSWILSWRDRGHSIPHRGKQRRRSHLLLGVIARANACCRVSVVTLTVLPPAKHKTQSQQHYFEP